MYFDKFLTIVEECDGYYKTLYQEKKRKTTIQPSLDQFEQKRPDVNQ